LSKGRESERGRAVFEREINVWEAKATIIGLGDAPADQPKQVERLAKVTQFCNLVLRDFFIQQSKPNGDKKIG
jgi:hypothetical protein